MQKVLTRQRYHHGMRTETTLYKISGKLYQGKDINIPIAQDIMPWNYPKYPNCPDCGFKGRLKIETTIGSMSCPKCGSMFCQMTSDRKFSVGYWGYP